MTITQLIYFQAICQHDSVTNAARSLNVSQPALSNSIRDLEDEFGLNLFTRRSKRLVLTKTGEYFLSRVLPILDNYHEILMDMRSLSNTRNNIRIGMQTFTSTIIAPRLITDFHNKHPDAVFETKEGSSYQIAEAVASGFLDVGIVNLPSIKEEQFEVQKLYFIPLYFCVCKDDPLAKYTELDLKDIADHPIVTIADRMLDTGGISSAFKNAGLKPNIEVTTYQYSAVVEYVRNGGVGAFLCKEHIQLYDDIVPIYVKEIPPFELGLISQKSDHVYADTANFIAFVQDWVHEHPEIGGLLK